MPASTACSVFADMPFRPRSVPPSAARRRSSSVSTPSSSWSCLTVRGPTPGICQQRHQARRHFLAQLLVEGHAAGSGQLLDLLRDGVAHALDPRRVAVQVGARDLDRRMGDRVGGPVVGDGLEDELALDLEHVADLVEDAGQLAVRRDRGRFGLGHRSNGSRGAAGAAATGIKPRGANRSGSSWRRLTARPPRHGRRPVRLAAYRARSARSTMSSIASPANWPRWPPRPRP